MYKKNTFLILFILFFGFFQNTEAEFNSFENNKKDCFELIKKENKLLNIDGYVLQSNNVLTNDGLTGMNFGVNSLLLEDIDKNQEELFSQESYFYGEKSKLLKSDFYRGLILYTNNEDNNNFYSSELNFVDIKIDGKKEFLQCNITNNSNLKGKIEDIDIGDIVLLYEPFQKQFDITEFNYNNKKWKKIITKIFYKDKDGKEDIFKIESIYFIPYNQELKNYYNFYDLVSLYGEKLMFFNNRLDEIKKDKSNIKEIYNENGLIISKYNFPDGEKTDKYGLKYLFVNGSNYFISFNKLRRNTFFHYLLKNNSPLVDNIYSFRYEEDNSFEDYVFWVNFHLGNIKKLPLKNIEAIPYYTNTNQIISKEYHKVNDIVSKEEFNDYILSEVFDETNKNNELNKDEILGKIKEVILDENISDIIEEKIEERKINMSDENETIEQNEIIEQTNNNKSKNFIIILVIITLILGSIFLTKKK